MFRTTLVALFAAIVIGTSAASAVPANVGVIKAMAVATQPQQQVWCCGRFHRPFFFHRPFAFRHSFFFRRHFAFYHPFFCYRHPFFCRQI